MNLLFYGTSYDQSYLPYLKSCIGANSCRVLTKPVDTITELEIYCKQHNIKSVIFTRADLLQRLIGNTEGKISSIDSYAGSLFKRNELQFVAIDPLQQLVSVPYGKFLTKRYISKLTEPDKWFPSIAFNWEIVSASNFEHIFNRYSSATLIAVDIETYKSPLSIRCIGYTAVWIDDDSGDITSHSCVLPLDSAFALGVMRKFNWELQAPKVMQNGKYDNSYLCAYNAPVYNWLFDTATMFHSWYSELPKDLGFLGGFFVREAMYWKDLANTTDLHEYYLYNCRDTWTTAISCMAWLREAPDWAKRNYLMEFPVNFPSHLCEMTGIASDSLRVTQARLDIDNRIQSNQTSLNTMLGGEVNVNSSPQMKTVCKILGLGKYVGKTYTPVESCDEDSLKKFSFLHPLNNRIFSRVLDIRGDRKLKSTYLRTNDDAKKNGEGGSKEFKGRILYSINPHGTDTGRNASKEHHFWCGLNIQNIPRGKEVKQTLCADEDFVFAECDLEQAESRDVANISGDARLLSAVSGDNDFHATNCSAFFGVPYRDIYDNATRKTLNKSLRDLAKRVNHGANYCMGASVLVDTMGLEKVYEAARLLRLDRSWSPLQICQHLLDCFHKAYPGLSAVMYPGIWSDVLVGNTLVGATGWTRYCFDKPIESNKHARNKYVAHVPQSLNAMVLNKAFIKVFNEISMSPIHGAHFKLLAQIHDSILFQFRIGHNYLCQMVKERMEIPVTVKGYDGVVRTFTVPAAIKAGANGLGAAYWSDTE